MKPVALQPVRRRPGVVGLRQGAAEVAGRLGGELAGLDPGQDQAVGLDGEHLGHPDAAGLAEPAQPGGLGLEEARSGRWSASS